MDISFLVKPKKFQYFLLFTLYFILSNMFTYYQAIVFGILQGVTELFPISSLGHSVILPSILRWNIDQNAPFFLTFLVATHFATAIVLFLFFWKDWKRILSGIFRSLKEREIKESDTYAKLGWLLVVATIPAGILGITLEKALKNLFAYPQLVAGVLILNGIMLLAADTLRKSTKEQREQESDRRIANLSFMQGVKVGILQCLALLPGFSRTGATMTGGLLVGLAHEDAARFAFLLATPIIGAAALLKLPELSLKAENAALGPIIAGAICSALAAYFSVSFLTKYFQTKNLKVFGVYCLAAGIIASILILFSL